MLPLVFLPGMMCDGRLFGPQIDALWPRVPIICAPVGLHDSMQALAAEVLAYAPPRFALAGLSMGGILAMELVRQAPGRVDRLALLDTNPLAELPEVQARRQPQIDRVLAGDLDGVMAGDMIPNYFAAGADSAALADLCLAMARDLGPDVFANQSRALRDRPDQTATLRGYGGPTLVLCGEEDRLCPVERHQLMHDLIPGSRLEILPGAGHLPTLEQPLAVNAALSAWLDMA